MAFPAEHFGSVERRTWFKVRWKEGHEAAGKFDVLPEDVASRYKDMLDVLASVETKKCVAGLPLGFGKSEGEVDEWIERNR